MKATKPSRKKLIAALYALLGEKWFIRTTEEFDGSKGGVWTTNERCSRALDGATIVAEGGFLPHPKVKAILDAHGFYCEPYDSGTLMIYPA